MERIPKGIYTPEFRAEAVKLVETTGMPVAVSGEPHKPAGVAFGQIVLLDHLADRLALDLWG